jgi:hypothetical protein
MHMGSTNWAYWAEATPHKIKIALVQLNVDMMEEDAFRLWDIPKFRYRSKRSSFGMNLAKVSMASFLKYMCWGL